jgi:hypothetical protein
MANSKETEKANMIIPHLVNLDREKLEKDITLQELLEEIEDQSKANGVVSEKIKSNQGDTDKKWLKIRQHETARIMGVVHEVIIHRFELLNRRVKELETELAEMQRKSKI